LAIARYKVSKRRGKVSINSAYKEVIVSLIDCYLRGEFDARYLANEINSVPLPKAKTGLEEEGLEKYYTWLIRELKPEEIVKSS